MEGGDDMHARLCGMFLQQSRGMLCTGLRIVSLPPSPSRSSIHVVCVWAPTHALHQRLIKTSKHPAVSSTSPCFISQLCSQNHHRCIAADLPAHPFSARSSDRSIPYQAEA